MALRSSNCLPSTSREWVTASGLRVPIRSQSTRSRHAMQYELQRPRDGPRDAYWAIQGLDEPAPDRVRPHPYMQMSPGRAMRRFFRKGKIDYPVEDHFPYIPPLGQSTWRAVLLPRVGFSRAAVGDSLGTMRRVLFHWAANMYSGVLIRGILKTQTLLDARAPIPSWSDLTTLRGVRYLAFRYRKARKALYKGTLEPFCKNKLVQRYVPAYVLRLLRTPRAVHKPEVDILSYKDWQNLALVDVELQFDAYLRALQSGLEADIQAFKAFEPSDYVLSDLRDTINQRNSNRVTVQILPIGQGSQAPEIVGVRCNPRQESADKEYESRAEQMDQVPWSAQICVRFQTRQIVRTYPRDGPVKVIKDSETGVTVIRKLSQAAQDKYALESVQTETRDVLQYFIYQRNFGSRRRIDERHWYCVAETFEGVAAPEEKETVPVTSKGATA